MRPASAFVGILLVERDASFTAALARSTIDTLSILFTADYPSGVPSLNIIATESSSLLDAEDEDGAGDFGQIFITSKSLSIYRAGIEAPLVIQLGLLAHEIAHAIQSMMDFDPSEIPSAGAMPKNFLAFMADFGWTTQELDTTPNRRLELFQPHYPLLPTYTTEWNGYTATEWRERLSQTERPEDESRDLGIIGFYALNSPEEWYADHVISFLYISMMDAVRSDCSEKGWNELDQWLNEAIAESWPEFVYSNARGTAFQQQLEQMFPITLERRLRLAEHYLNPGRFCSP